MAVVVGVIAEGQTDVEVLKVILREHLAAAGVVVNERELEVRRLFPEPDGTTGGGWSVLASWLKAHGPLWRRRRYLEPLFADEAPCNALLVHLDGDVATHVAAALGWPEPAPTPAGRAQVIHDALMTWLFPEGAADPAHVILPAVWCTETWLVVGLVPVTADPEAVDPAPWLIGVSPGLATPGGKLRKSVERWRKLAKRRLAGEVDRVVARCAHLKQALDQLNAALGAP
jgi:hypothetical protein